MRSFILQVIIMPNEDGRYWAEIPALPACLSSGETREEALANIKTAAKRYLEALGEDNYELSNECTLSEVEITL